MERIYATTVAGYVKGRGLKLSGNMSYSPDSLFAIQANYLHRNISAADKFWKAVKEAQSPSEVGKLFIGLANTAIDWSEATYTLPYLSGYQVGVGPGSLASVLNQAAVRFEPEKLVEVMTGYYDGLDLLERYSHLTARDCRYEASKWWDDHITKVQAEDTAERVAKQAVLEKLTGQIDQVAAGAAAEDDGFEY